MPKQTKAPLQPKFPALRKKCKYCRTEFKTPATANGQKMDFCKPAHRWAYAREGKKPIDWILKKQERRMREIVREETTGGPLGMFVRFCEQMERLSITPEKLRAALDAFSKNVEKSSDRLHNVYCRTCGEYCGMSSSEVPELPEYCGRHLPKLESPRSI